MEAQLSIPTIEPVRRKIKIYPAIKRVAEKTLALVLLALFSPVFLLFAILIWLDSPGPVLFRQTRIGKGGKEFTFIKFRSMRHNIDRSKHEAFLKAFVNGQVQDVEKGHTVFKPAQANEITSMGRFLRKTSLDELPQLWNIIKGEMSFIGPRPNLHAEVDAYKEWHKRRLEVLPGVTGLAQVNGRSSIKFDDIVRYDVEYIQNESLLTDLRIVLSTVFVVLLGVGAS